jgi:hypothetical protein
LFSELCKKLYGYADPQPEEVEFFVELHKMTRENPSELAIPDAGARFLFRIGSPAPSPGMRWTLSASIMNLDVGIIAFKLAAKLFEWYGVEHDQIPYQKEVGKIDRDSLSNS